MCAYRLRRGTAAVAAAVIAVTAGGCSSNERTGTNFCRRLAETMPEIGQAMSTQGDVLEQVTRYDRLLEVAPLSIESDLRVLTDLLRRASEVDPNDPTDIQALADAAYAAERSAEAVAAWTVSTCAVDIRTGMRVDPPRQPPATTTTTEVPQSPQPTTPPETAPQDTTVTTP